MDKPKGRILLLIILMLFLLLPLKVMAVDSITVNSIGSVKPGDTITIAGETGLKEIGIKVISSNGTILYVDVVGIQNNTYNKTFTLPQDALTGEYKLVVGQGSNIAVNTFSVKEKSSGGGGGGGGGFSSTPKGTVSTSGGQVSENGVTVDIPRGAVSENIKVEIEKVLNISNLNIPENSKLVSNVLEIIKDKTGDFAKAVTIKISFNKDEVDLAKYDLGIYWYNEDTEQWVKLDNIVVDAELGVVRGDANHFTKFAIMATEKEQTQAVEKAKPQVPVVNETIKPQGKISFADIEGHWAENIINTLVARGVTTGYADGSFKPNNNITRAEFIVFLVRAFNLSKHTGADFIDIKGHWAEDNINTAYYHGVVSGFNDGKEFRPDELITREQMAAMLMNLLNFKVINEEIDFKDKDRISGWAKNAIITLAKNNIMSGYEDYTWKPQHNATRAEALTAIYNSLNL